jgi:tetratricopeptide (TPR) repeat protein
MFNIFKKKEEENIVERFLRLMDEGNYSKALPIIKEIISRSPNISTSHFNYGVCLEGLEQHNDAAEAFLKAYELDNEDGGALYRTCISLAKANNKARLYEVFERELEYNPLMINNFLEEEMLSKFFVDERFIKLRDRYSDYLGREYD